MQRGRGRGRNPNRVRSTSRREGRSASSRRAASRSRSRVAPRRSARLAQLVNGDSEAAENPMADVVRRRTQTADRLGNRAVGQRSGVGRSSQSSRRHGNRHPSSTNDPDEFRYGMDILVQPPATAALGDTLNPPLTVRLRSLSGDLNEAIAESASLVVVVTLTPAQSPVGGDTTDLSGALGGRYFLIHPFGDEDDSPPLTVSTSDPRGLGYVSFSDLSIRRAGTYRIRVSLIRMPRTIPSDPPASPLSAGLCVQVVESNPITVQGNGGTASPMALQQGDGDDDGGWLEALRTMRTRRRSRG